MAILRVNVVLPERSNTFFNAMADLLPKQIFNVDPEFMIPRLEPVVVNGTVVPFATVKVFINDIDKSPVPDIVADANGAWSGTFLLTPGQNTIQVQFFPPEASGDIENAYAPTLFVRNVLVHPTLFSPFPMKNKLQMLLLDGAYLYLGNYIPFPVDAKTIARYDLTTGGSIVLDEGTGSPLSGRVYFMALDATWLYVSQTMGDASIKVSRYAKDLSAKLDHAGYTSVPNALYSDGTSLFVVRSPGDVLLSKLNPTTMALVGSEISIKVGAIFENALGHNAMCDDGTNLMIPMSRLISGDSIGDAILPGSPDLGGNFIFNNLLFHRKVLKSTLTPDAFPHTLYTGTNSPDEAFVGKNSLVRFGGFYYTLVLSNPGRVIKLQEATLFGGPALEPIEITPLPFSAAGSEHDLPPRMKLGPDSRLYVVGSPGLARFTPGSNSIQWLPRGAQSMDVTSTDVAVVDDTVLTRAIDAAPAIFTDRAQTFTVVAPTVAPTNVRCHFNQTRTHFAVGWTPTTDGNGAIIEYDVNGGGYGEAAREYFGSGHVIPAGSFVSGDTFSFRVRSFNSVGTSVPSAIASFFVPFLTPNLGAATNLVVTSVVGSTANLQWEDHEIVVGGPINATTNRSHHLYIYRSTDNLNFVHVGTKSLVVSATDPDGSPIGGAFYFNPITRTNTLVQFSDVNAGNYPYYYKVRQVQGTGPSLSFSGFVYGPGAYSNVVTADAPPATPFHVAWEAGWEGAYVTWIPGVGTGDGPAGIAFDGTNMWITNDARGGVSKVSPSGVQVVYSNIASSPFGIVFDGTNMWTSNTGDNSVTKISPAGVPTNYPGQPVLSGGGVSAAYNSITGDIWVVGDGSVVSKVTPSTGVISVYNLTGGTGAKSIAFDGVNMWTLNQGNNSVTKVTPAGVATTYTGIGPNSWGIAFDGVNMWTTSANNGASDSTITKISPAGAMTTYPMAGARYAFGIAFDGTNMWTANQITNNLSKVSPAGVVTNYPVGAGTGPSVIAYNSTTTDMWVTCQGSNNVAKVTSAGAVTFYGAGAGQPFSIVFDGTNMWVTTGAIGISKITPAGVATNYLGAGGSGYAMSMAYDGSNIWLGDNGGSIVKWTSAGVKATSVLYATNSIVTPVRIAYDGANTWTVNQSNNTVTKVTSAGAMTTYPVGLFTVPKDIAFDGTNMWTVNSGNASVSKVSPAGAITTYALAGGVTLPYGIAFDGTNMWTANAGNNSVSKVTPAGVVTTYTGTGVNPGQIAFDGTNMWTSNFGDNSVTKITPAGAMSGFSGTGAVPADIAFDGTNMWTANEGENSVTKVTPTGVMTTYATGSGGGTITGFTVKRSIDNTVSYPTSFVVGNVTSYHDTTAFGNAQVRYDKIFATGPGGNSADSPIQGSVFSLAPVYHEVKIKNTDNINGPLLLDGSFAYAIASLSDGAIATTITKIDLTNSGNRTQNLAVYNPVGLSALVNSAVMFGGFIYILLKDNGEAFQRIIKVNPANLLQVGTFALATGNASGGLLVTDGTDCWAITGPSGSVKVTHFDPVAMSIILTGTSSFGAGVSTSSMGATAFGGKIFASIHNFNTATDYVIRVDATTLAIAETVSTSAVTFPGAMTNDGTNVYCHGGSGGQARIEKFSTGPLAFAASTANLGFVSQASLAYDSGSAAIYLAGRQTALVGGTNNSLMKVSTAPAFVSAISQVHFTDGTIDGTRTDGTYAYFSNNNGYVARELISSF